MLPHANGDNIPVAASQMAPIDNNGKVNGVNGNVAEKASRPADNITQARNPYAPRYGDFLSNVSNFNIIESTLRGRVMRIVDVMPPC
jgi:homocitrate synthase